MNTSETTSASFDALRQTGRKLWLAGLGALAQIEEMGEEGRGLFGRLVERGRPLEARQKQVMDDLGQRAEARLREVGELVRDQVRYDVRRVMQRAGVPTSEDFSRLAARLETLSAKLGELAQNGAVPTVPGATDLQT